MPFGNSLCKVDNNIKIFSSNLSSVITSLEYYDVYKNENLFSSKSYILKTENFKAVSSVNTPVSIKVNNTEDITLLIPFFGENTSIIDNKSFFWGEKSKQAIILPKTARAGFSSIRSTLSIDINEKKINEIASSMIGKEMIVKLNETKLINLKYKNVDFIAGIKALCSLIDANNCDNKILEKLEIDEIFYRQIVSMLFPENFFDEKVLEEAKRFNHKNILKQVIEYSKNEPNFFKKVSDLEKFTGLSTRTLQYTFNKHLDTNPKNWIREQQLIYAMKLLKNKDSNLTISQIALEIGYSNFSLFAKYFKEYHGFLPSEVLRQNKKF